MVKVNEIVAKKSTTGKKAIRLNLMVELIECYVAEHYYEQAIWKPTVLIGNTPGVDGIQYQTNPKKPKVGQSVSRGDRTKRCSGKKDKKYNLFEQEDCNKSVSDYCVNAALPNTKSKICRFVWSYYSRILILLFRIKNLMCKNMTLQHQNASLISALDKLEVMQYKM